MQGPPLGCEGLLVNAKKPITTEATEHTKD